MASNLGTPVRKKIPMKDARGWAHPAKAGGNGVDLDLLPTAKGRCCPARVSVQHDIRSNHAKAQTLKIRSDFFHATIISVRFNFQTFSES